MNRDASSKKRYDWKRMPIMSARQCIVIIVCARLYVFDRQCSSTVALCKKCVTQIIFILSFAFAFDFGFAFRWYLECASRWPTLLLDQR